MLTLSHGVFQVFSNKTAWDPVCLEVRGKLVPSGVRREERRRKLCCTVAHAVAVRAHAKDCAQNGACFAILFIFAPNRR